MYRFVFALLLPVVLSGCAGIQKLVSDAEVRPTGGGLNLMLSTDHPAGLYILETTDGKPVARGVLQDTESSRRSLSLGARIPLTFYVDVRQRPEAIGCLRVRRPDGQMIGIGALQTEGFRLPSMEAAYIRQVELGELQRAESHYQRNQRLVARTQQWIATAPAELTASRSCRVPTATASTCRSESTAIEAARRPCFDANFACSLAGASMDALVSQLETGRRGASTLANLIGSNVCSLAADKHHGQQSDILLYLRSIGVSLTVDALYRSLVNDNPGTEETFLLAAAAGAINFRLCLSDAVDQCQASRDQWQRQASSRYRACQERLAQYQRAVELLEKYGSPAEIQKAIQVKQERLVELNSRSVFQRTPLVAQVQACR